MQSPKSNTIRQTSHPSPTLSGQLTVMTHGSPGSFPCLISTRSSSSQAMAISPIHTESENLSGVGRLNSPTGSPVRITSYSHAQPHYIALPVDWEGPIDLCGPGNLHWRLGNKARVETKKLGSANWTPFSAINPNGLGDCGVKECESGFWW